MSTILKEKPAPLPRPDEIEGVPVKVTERDVLHRAADLLEEFGWCQHELAIDSEGQSLGCDVSNPGAVGFCAIGAILRADSDFGREKYSTNWDNVSPTGSTMLASWNNAPGRTKKEVVTALRDAAERA